MSSLSEFILLFTVAVAANTLSAMAGGGAGLLQLPALLFLGLPFHVALATHKVASVFLGIGSATRYWQERIIRWRFAAVILGTGLPGVMLGAVIVIKIDAQITTFALGILTLSVGIYSFFKKELGQYYQLRHNNLKGMLIGGSVIFIIGITNGSLTSGTGLLLTLWLVYWFGFDYKRAVAYTLILVGLFWNGTGALTLATLGDVKWSWLAPLILGALTGGYLGAHMGIAKGNRWIKRLFESLTILTGISLALKAFYG